MDNLLQQFGLDFLSSSGAKDCSIVSTVDHPKHLQPAIGHREWLQPVRSPSRPYIFSEPAISSKLLELIRGLTSGYFRQRVS